jgi:hypothetical protein
MSKLKEAIEKKDWLKAKRLIIDNPEYLEENVELLLDIIYHKKWWISAESQPNHEEFKQQYLQTPFLAEDKISLHIKEFEEECANYKEPPEDLFPKPEFKEIIIGGYSEDIIHHIGNIGYDPQKDEFYSTKKAVEKDDNWIPQNNFFGVDHAALEGDKAVVTHLAFTDGKSDGGLMPVDNTNAQDEKQQQKIQMEDTIDDIIDYLHTVENFELIDYSTTKNGFIIDFYLNPPSSSLLYDQFMQIIKPKIIGMDGVFPALLSEEFELKAELSTREMLFSDQEKFHLVFRRKD